jgi:hypothetical protein
MAQAQLMSGFEPSRDSTNHCVVHLKCRAIGKVIVNIDLTI